MYGKSDSESLVARGTAEDKRVLSSLLKSGGELKLIFIVLSSPIVTADLVQKGHSTMKNGQDHL